MTFTARLATCLLLTLAALAVVTPPAGAGELDADAVLAPGSLDEQRDRRRPSRRLVGRRLAADAPLAPGAVKPSSRPAHPGPPEILPPGAAVR